MARETLTKAGRYLNAGEKKRKLSEKRDNPYTMRCFLFSLFLLPSLLLAQLTYDVRDFGAIADTQQLATQAIQAAIDSAATSGGGIVYLPPGDYLSGTLQLKDNITLWLEAGATLYASRRAGDYAKDQRDQFGNPVLLYADSANHISLKGRGVIDGQAVREYRDLEEVDKFIEKETELAREAGVEMKIYYKVPPFTALLFFQDCQHLSFENLTFRESNFWTIHLLRCRRIFMRGLYVYSDLEKGVNADGIDINGCQDVLISDCVVITGDDGICLKSKVRNSPTENVTVTNCVVSSSSTALKIGTETYSDFRHIIFSNCVVRNSNRGLSIVVRDGATVSDVLFSNITIECRRRHFNWWGDGDPLWLVVLKRRENSAVGKIEKVRFHNILASGPGSSRIESGVGRNIRGIDLRGVHLHMLPEQRPDKRASHAFIASQVDELSIDDLRISWEESPAPPPNWGSALLMEGVNGLKISDFEGRQGDPKGEAPVIHLKGVKSALLRDCEQSGGEAPFLQRTDTPKKEVRRRKGL
jgi:hypothetical protein